MKARPAPRRASWWFLHPSSLRSMVRQQGQSGMRSQGERQTLGIPPVLTACRSVTAIAVPTSPLPICHGMLRTARGGCTTEVRFVHGFPSQPPFRSLTFPKTAQWSGVCQPAKFDHSNKNGPTRGIDQLFPLEGQVVQLPSGGTHARVQTEAANHFFLSLIHFAVCLDFGTNLQGVHRLRVPAQQRMQPKISPIQSVQ